MHPTYRRRVFYRKIGIPGRLEEVSRDLFGSLMKQAPDVLWSLGDSVLFDRFYPNRAGDRSAALTPRSAKSTGTPACTADAHLAAAQARI